MKNVTLIKHNKVDSGNIMFKSDIYLKNIQWMLITDIVMEINTERYICIVEYPKDWKVKVCGSFNIMNIVCHLLMLALFCG